MGRQKSGETSSSSSPAKPEVPRAKETAGLRSLPRSQAVCVPRSAPTATPRCCGQGRRISGAWWASATCGAMTSSWTPPTTGRPTTMRCATATLTTWRQACASWAPAAASPTIPCTSVLPGRTTGEVGAAGDGGRSGERPLPEGRRDLFAPIAPQALIMLNLNYSDEASVPTPILQNTEPQRSEVSCPSCQQ